MGKTNTFFNDKKVAKSYDAVLGIDKHISLPGVYDGMLSDITVDVAEALINIGDNQVVKKTDELPPSDPPSEGK